MDSTVLLIANKNIIGLCVSFDYGSKHNEMEITQALKNTKELGIEHIVIKMDFINEYFKSDLLKSGGDIPDGHYKDSNMSKTVVPFRNGIMLSIATGLAETRKLDGVLIGSHSGDHTIYPDCRPEFNSSMRSAMIKGTNGMVSLYVPFTAQSKREIAKYGQRLGVDFTKTYSCYKGGEIHCGKCATCVERIEALKGFDPTNYLDTTFALKTLENHE